MATFNPGTYTGKGYGVRGKIIIEVTFSETEITGIEIIKHKEIFGQAYGLESSPFENYIPKIIQYQSLAVPMVVGAETVCKAIVKAISTCVKEAGGDLEALKNKSVPIASKKEDRILETDVVIFGSGIAGFSAALEAQCCGADVILVEKQGIVGGSSAICGGKIIAAGSEVQKKQGILDTPQMLFNFLKNAAGNFLDDDKINYFCYHSAENLEWLVEQGFEIQDLEAPHSSQLPWRIHNSIGGEGQTMGWGGSFIVPLNNLFKERGGTVLLDTSLTELIVKEGRVSGATAVDTLDGSTVKIMARKGVILCTGGFAANREVVEARYPWMKNYYYNCPESSQGDGALAAEAIGARNYHHPYLQTMLLHDRSGAGVNEESGLIVTRDGKRFCNEYQFHSLVGAELAKTGSPGAWYITCGEEPYPLLNYALTLSDTPKAGNIEELAEKMDVAPEILNSTVDRYNYLCETGFDEDFEKPSSELHALKGPEYYAVFLKPAASITFGGLEIDIAAKVLDRDGRVIPGLFASGEVANTGNFGHGVPSCGYSLGHALHFGRVAARSACGKELL
ncbi:FAD-dependent oxidoreductase [Proteocatella sphenisci]|uniref:FAD-dependent oxidoreductase n=1 Tax=Proteocatella sphenisci TaxID=181070 RepID=UPI00048CA6BD|nr:FAD-dependent oxidoreductase [Proteocatella sphenisci]